PRPAIGRPRPGRSARPDPPGTKPARCPAPASGGPSEARTRGRPPGPPSTTGAATPPRQRPSDRGPVHAAAHLRPRAVHERPVRATDQTPRRLHPPRRTERQVLGQPLVRIRQPDAGRGVVALTGA